MKKIVISVLFLSAMNSYASYELTPKSYSSTESLELACYKEKLTPHSSQFRDNRNKKLVDEQLLDRQNKEMLELVRNVNNKQSNGIKKNIEPKLTCGHFLMRYFSCRKATKIYAE